MAQKRMFSREITDSDSFLDLSLAAQCVYFHICLAADDEGFISAGKRIARSIGASAKELDELVDRGFLIPFPETGVYVAAHFMVNNTLKSDRFHETVYQAERKQVELNENKVYTIRNHDGTMPEPERNQTGIENSIDKNSIAQEREGKKSKDKVSPGEGSSEGGTPDQEMLLLFMAQQHGIKADVEKALSQYGFSAAHAALTAWRNAGAVIGKYNDYLKGENEK